MLGKNIINHIRRYSHTHNSPSSIKDPILDYKVLESKMDKIMLKLEHIEVLVKCNYFLVIIPGILLFFK